MTVQQVSILVVGDEILTGDTQESNAYYMARELFAHGVQLRRVVVVPDDVEEIAAQVRTLSATYDVLITCGGIGPTHDDVTMDGVARAFGAPLVPHPELLALVETWRGSALDDSHRRLAQIPEGAELIWSDQYFPLVRLRNVYVLPGVPRLLQRKFQHLLPLLHGEPQHQRQFHTDQNELALAEPLREVQQSHPNVTIGSYPQATGTSDWKVRLVLKSRDAEALELACKHLLEHIDGLDELPVAPKATESSSAS